MVLKKEAKYNLDGFELRTDRPTFDVYFSNPEKFMTDIQPPFRTPLAMDRCRRGNRQAATEGFRAGNLLKLYKKRAVRERRLRGNLNVSVCSPERCRKNDHVS